MRLQKGFVHFQNRDLREGQTRTWRRGRERARQREKRRRERERESRCLGATKHVLRRERTWLAWSPVARVEPHCGMGASTTVEAGPGRSPRVKSLLSMSVSVSVCLCLCLCLFFFASAPLADGEPCLEAKDKSNHLTADSLLRLSSVLSSLVFRLSSSLVSLFLCLLSLSFSVFFVSVSV